MAELPEGFLSAKGATHEQQIARGQVADVLRGREGIYVRNLNRVLVELDAISARTKKKTIALINKSLASIAVKARNAVPTDTGTLQQSIRPQIAKENKRGVIRGYVRANADYAAWVEFGTWKQTKKKKKAKWPKVEPGSPLYLWAVRHNIPPVALAISMGRREAGATRIRNEFGRLLGRKRARSKGVEKRPFLGPAFVSERPKVYRRLLDVLGARKVSGGS